MTEQNKSDLEVLLPEPLMVEAGGEDIAIGHMKTRQIPIMLRCAGPVVQELQQGAMPIDIIGRHGELVIAAVAVATGKDSEWVGQLDPHEFLDLFVAVIEVNSDFFVRVLLPRIVEAANRIETTFGGLQLPGSSGTGTS